jgi:hypothetical protein
VLIMCKTVTRRVMVRNRMVKSGCVYFDSNVSRPSKFRIGKDLSDSNCILN